MTPQPPRILIAEDSEDNRLLLCMLLQYNGFEVIEAASGVDALSLATRERPDLILMDLSLPVIDGWTAMRWLKDDPKLRHIPILALSMHDSSADIARAREAGCDGYFVKPIDVNEFISQLKPYLPPR